MTTGICDMHCHILPNLDDGSKSMEETVRTVQEAVNQGIRTIIATPHFYPGRYETKSSGAVLCRTGVLLLFRTAASAKRRAGADTGGKPVRAGGIFTGLYLFSAVWRAY